MVSPIDPNATALMILDMQVDSVTEAGASAEMGAWRHAREQGTIPHIQALAERARARAMPVIHIHHVLYNDGRDSPQNAPLFRALIESGAHRAGSRGAEPIPELRPEPGDFVIVKQRVGAFAGTDLDIKLRGLGAKKILVTGTWTNFSVESTCRYGVDLGYEIVLITDATCSTGADWQAASTYYALRELVEMARTDEILAALG